MFQRGVIVDIPLVYPFLLALTFQPHNLFQLRWPQGTFELSKYRNESVKCNIIYLHPCKIIYPIRNTHVMPHNTAFLLVGLLWIQNVS